MFQPHPAHFSRGIKRWIEQKKAQNEFYEVSVRLGAFGGLSWKALSLKGTNPALVWLGQIYSTIYPKMKSRQCKKLSKPAGKRLGRKGIWIGSIKQYTTISNHTFLGLAGFVGKRIN